MKLHALILIGCLTVTSLVPQGVEARARAPMRRKIVTMTTGETTTYTSTKRYKKGRTHAHKKSRPARRSKRAKH